MTRIPFFLLAIGLALCVLVHGQSSTTKPTTAKPTTKPTTAKPTTKPTTSKPTTTKPTTVKATTTTPRIGTTATINDLFKNKATPKTTINKVNNKDFSLSFGASAIKIFSTTYYYYADKTNNKLMKINSQGNATNFYSANGVVHLVATQNGVYATDSKGQLAKFNTNLQMIGYGTCLQMTGVNCQFSKIFYDASNDYLYTTDVNGPVFVINAARATLVGIFRTNEIYADMKLFNNNWYAAFGNQIKVMNKDLTNVKSVSTNCTSSVNAIEVISSESFVYTCSNSPNVYLKTATETLSLTLDQNAVGVLVDPDNKLVVSTKNSFKIF